MTKWIKTDMATLTGRRKRLTAKQQNTVELNGIKEGLKDKRHYSDLFSATRRGRKKKKVKKEVDRRERYCSRASAKALPLFVSLSCGS